MWIRPESINRDSSNKKIVDSSILYSISTSKYLSFEVHLKGNSLYYCLRENNNLGVIFENKIKIIRAISN